MRKLTALAALLGVTAYLPADAPLLERLSVYATGAVTVTIPRHVAPRRPLYLTAEGVWKPLEVRFQDKTATFTVPADAGGKTVVLLDAPDWLVLEDDAPPAVERVVVDGEPVDVAAEIDLGHQPGGVKKVTVLFRDKDNPIDAASAVITLDGMPLKSEAVKVVGTKNAPETRFIEVTPGELKPAAHTLRLRVPDAAAVPHYAQVTLRFNSGPLLKNGGFEDIKPDGTPLHWTINTWSVNAETRAELKVVKGGHSGEHCAEILGIAGSLNLLFGQKAPLSGNRTYVVRGWYQATSPTVYLSMINASKDENKQYLNSPRLKPTEAWKPFEWQFTTKPSPSYTLYLRSGGKGYARFDDVELTELRPSRKP